MSAELQPDELDALQAEETVSQPAVIVKHEGPVRVQELPRKSAASRTRVIDGTMRKYLSADHRRAQCRIIATVNPIYIAFSSAGAADPSTCGIWPVNTPFTLTADSELWLGAQTGGTATVSFFTEFWATGE